MKITTELFTELDKLISKHIEEKQITDSIQGTTDIEGGEGGTLLTDNKMYLGARKLEACNISAEIGGGLGESDRNIKNHRK